MLLGALAGDAQIVTITGPGGVGKTRLAREVAARSQDGYPDGVAVVSLDGLADPVLVVAEIAAALGVEQSGPEALVETVKHSTRDRELLIVLDNFEHLLPAAGTVAELRDAAPGVQLLITSREPLRLDGEREFPLDPLPAPDPAAGHADALAGNPAAALFLDRASAAEPRFRLTAENATAVAGICNALDGLRWRSSWPPAASSCCPLRQS